MSSSSINSATRAQPLQPSHAGNSMAAKQADPHDVGAMRDALAAAKGSVDRQAGGKAAAGKAPGGGPAGDKQAGTPGKKHLASPGGERGREAEATPAEAETSPTAHLKSREEGADSLAGWAGQGAGAAQAAAAANPQAPHVDAGAFAQMLADLWTRENGRGSKEVRVRFGDRSWPATGAVLVRNEGGTLDVALQVGDGGQAYGTALPDLESAMRDSGIALGSLSIEHDG